MFLCKRCLSLLNGRRYDATTKVIGRWLSSANNNWLGDSKFRKLIRKLGSEYELANKQTSTNANTSLFLKPISDLVHKIDICERDIQELSSIKEDNKEDDLKKLADEETATACERLKRYELEILDHLLPDAVDDSNDVIVEVNQGVGGQEAMLFASDLFRMYCQFATYRGWTIDIQEEDVAELGGTRRGSVLIEGKDVYKNLKYEAGIHRVQRIPKTEKSGRIHTSTAAVLVLPQPKEIQLVIEKKDLKVETMTSSGPGGQHVNKVASCVRVTHLPTGIAVLRQTSRLQQTNHQEAMKVLRAKLYQRELDEQMRRIRTQRKLQVKSSDRSEKIRTYNFNQDRITDHRVGISVSQLESVLEGTENFAKLVEKLQREDRNERIRELIDAYDDAEQIAK